MIDLNKRYTTWDGREVRALSQVNYECDNPIQGYYRSGGEWRFGTWATDGRWSAGLDEDEALDLVEAPAEGGGEVGEHKTRDDAAATSPAP